MSSLYLTDEDIHGCEENDTEMLLRSRLDKANEKIEELEDTIKSLKETIIKDLQVNKRCLYENNLSAPVEILLNNWVKYDNELLELLKEE